ncbi:MAG: hypothetical protein WD847_19670 [Pirellulales bacterium]
MATPDQPDDRQGENPYRAPAQQPAPESTAKLATGRIMIAAACFVVNIGIFVGLLIVEQSRHVILGHNRLPLFIIMSIILPGIALLVTVWQAFAERRRQQRRVPNP